MPTYRSNEGFDLLADMKPVFLAQPAQKTGDQFQRAMLRGPFNMLGQAKHLEHRRRVVPCGENQRQCWLPTGTIPLAIWQHLSELIPQQWVRTNAIVLAAICDKALDRIANSANPMRHELGRLPPSSILWWSGFSR